MWDCWRKGGYSPVMDDMDKAEVLDAFSVPTEKAWDQIAAQATQAWEEEEQSRVELLQARGYLKDPDVFKSLGLDEIHLKVLKHTPEVIVKLLLICGQKLRQSGKAPYKWKKENIMPGFINGRKNHPGVTG